MAILAYMVIQKEGEGRRVTAHEISKKAPEFINKTQKPTRIMDHLVQLRQIGFVESEDCAMGTLWNITDKGYDFFKGISESFRLMFYS